MESCLSCATPAPAELGTCVQVAAASRVPPPQHSSTDHSAVICCQGRITEWLGCFCPYSVPIHPISVSHLHWVCPPGTSGITFTPSAASSGSAVNGVGGSPVPEQHCSEGAALPSHHTAASCDLMLVSSQHQGMAG